MDALVPFIASFSTKATTFGDPVVASKLGGEGTAKLTAKLGRAIRYGYGECAA
jgi:dihydroxyacetone kinase